MAECQNEQILADDASDDEMPRRTDPAPLLRHPDTAMAQVVMQAAGDVVNAGTSRIVEQVLKRLQHQPRVTLARHRTKVRLALLQDIIELPFRRPGE